jgi:phosphoribosylglycinamide formyltransferase 2
VDLAEDIADVGDGGASESGGFDSYAAVYQIEEVRQTTRRRMGVAVSTAADVETARSRAREAASKVRPVG